MHRMNRGVLQGVPVMNVGKLVRVTSNAIYIIGVAVLLTLLTFYIIGANMVPYPEAMIPWSMRDIAFMGLAIGAIPMGIACVAVYHFNRLRQSPKKTFKTILLFAPGVVCGICLLVAAGFIAFIMMKFLIETNILFAY